MIDDGFSKNSFRDFLRDRRGNFGIITALLLPMAMGTAGIAMDLTHVVKMKSELQNSADAAALAGASAMSGKGLSEAEAKEMAERYLTAQLMNLMKTGTISEEGLEQLEADIAESTDLAATEKVEGSSKTYEVTVNTHLDIPLNPLSQLLGFKTMSINATSTAQSTTESKNALSMYLVLDRSGSMGEDTDTVNAAEPTKQVAYSCRPYVWNGRSWSYSTCYSTQTNYVIKMDALKIAVADLTTQLNVADPEKQYVRLAAVSYNSSKQKETSFAWGTSTVTTYVNELNASGGTASTDAMKLAYQKLHESSEDNAHKAKNGQIPSKYILFMTDGDNNNTSDDTATINYCTKAKDEGMEIFSVAFMAPTRGQQLLENCASSADHYYSAKNATDLVAAFKQIGEKAAQAATRLTN